MAGRCISGTSEAAASYRGMPACIATGQAEGTAAAVSISEKINAGSISAKILKDILREQGTVIKDC